MAIKVHEVDGIGESEIRNQSCVTGIYENNFSPNSIDETCICHTFMKTMTIIRFSSKTYESAPMKWNIPYNLQLCIIALIKS